MDKRIKEDCVTLADHFLNFRLESGKSQSEMADALGCTLVSYQKWEKGVVEPLASFYPRIVDYLGHLPNEDLSTYSGILRSARLRQGKNLAEMAKDLGVKPEVWTRWEQGLFPPSSREIQRLKSAGIHLAFLGDHGSDEPPTSLSRALRAARTERGLSQADMGKYLGFSSNSAWCRYELGGVVPGKTFWPTIKEVLAVDLTQF